MMIQPVPSEARSATAALWSALVILGLAGVVAYETSVAVTDMTAWVEHTHDVIDRIAAERAVIAQVDTLRRAHGATSDARLAAYAEATRAAGANGNAIRALTADNAVEQERLGEIEALILKRASMFDAAVQMGTDDEMELGPTQLEAAHALDVHLDAVLADMEKEERRLLDVRRHETARTVRTLRLAQIAGTLVSFVLLIVAFRRLRRETTRRTRSQAAAMEGEESLARILAAIGDGVVATDVFGNVVRINRVTEELTGWSAKASFGKPSSKIIRLIDAETREPVADPVERALRERVSSEFDRPRLLLRRDGTEFRVTDSCALIRDAIGAVHGAVIVFRDVTEAQRAKTFFRALVEKSNDGIALTTADGAFTYASPAAARILGRMPEALLGTNARDYVHPDDMARAREHHRGFMDGPGAISTAERHIVRPDGTSCWIEVTSTNMIDDPAVGAIVRNMRDITERKTSEGALRASEFRFARLSESGLVGIVLFDTVGNLSDANDAYLRMVGYSRAHLAAGNVGWAAATPPECLGVDARATECLKGTGVAAPWEKEIVRKDGTRVPILVGAAMLDAHDCIAFVVDLSDRKRAAKTLRETEEQLRQAQKMDAVGRLAGGVAHDFNNMLSVILSYSDLLLADLTPADPMHADLNEIQSAGRKAADLTRQLLMFSRQQVIEPRAVDLNDVVSNMERMLKRLLGADIEVTLTRRSTASALVDPSGIEHVVMNLIVNARDAMPTGGKLTIETADVVLDEEYARHHVGVTPGPHVMLAVTDSGTGMDDATCARIFEPFFTTKEKGKGTGLGLSTVFGIAAQSGGSVWVYSELGLGTTFKVYLPCAPAETAQSVEVAPVSATLGGHETVLLVEDDDQVRAVARGILARTGYKVIEARNAGEALLSCEQYIGRIHLLLSDVVMPQMSGPELAKRLSAGRPDMRVLCMSGYTDDSIVRHGVLEAHFAFLQKPITPGTLTRKIREVLDAPRAA